MKKYLFIIPALFFAGMVFAQTNVSSTSPAVKDVVDKFTAKYNLDEDQVAKMVKVQQRRLRNLGEIANLENTDSAKFLQKRKAINSGMVTSIKMILTKSQMQLFDQDQAAIRMKKAEKMAELKSQGLTQAEMETHLVDIEDQQY